MLFNRGNSFTYAAGGWNENLPINKEKSLKEFYETLKVYYNLLKPGGYLYIDKFRDSEVPDRKVAARLEIKETGEEKDVIFLVDRKPEENVRFAQLSLRDVGDNSEKIMLIGTVYDLSEAEMEGLLKKVGFKKVEKIYLKEEKHFAVWLAQK